MVENNRGVAAMTGPSHLVGRTPPSAPAPLVRLPRAGRRPCPSMHTPDLEPQLSGAVSAGVFARPVDTNGPLANARGYNPAREGGDFAIRAPITMSPRRG